MTENSVAIEAVRLLVVSREPAVLRSLWSIGEANSWHLETVGSGWEALDRVQAGITPDLLLLDLPRGDADSLHILRWLRRVRPAMPIILLSHPDDAGREKESIRLGAQDYLIRPVQENQLEFVIRRQLTWRGDAVEMEAGSDDIEQVSDDEFFVGASPVMRKLRAQAELLAQANVPVLILGESGSGKDITAHLIHKLSVRSGFRFLKVNCGALPDDLLEGELLGYDRGALNGGVRPKPGKLELCNKGTILLDEITEMPFGVQSKLLEILQHNRIVRPGSDAAVEIDARILAATSANIDRAISEKKLREDLYYRLSAFTVHVPPLRQRKEELPLLLRHSMHRLARHYGLLPRDFTPAVLEACQSYSWPGNLRELEKFVKRYLVVGDQEVVFGEGELEAETSVRPARQTSQPSRSGLMTGDATESSAPNSLKSLVQNVKGETEKNAIAAALDKTGWNRKAAARLLRVSYRTLLYKIERYHMSAAESSMPPLLRSNGQGNGNGAIGNGNGNGLKDNGKAS
jgi:two-component system, NtrC family, response regulator AtoC